MFVPRSNRTRAEMLERLKHIKPATSFRSGYAYDNILYTVAGALIEAVSGQSYESYLRDHVYKPAGLLTATSDEPTRLGTVNRAYPHGRVGGPVRGLAPQQLLDETDQLGAASTPAGLLAMSANDLAKWLKIQLSHGKTENGGRLFSEASSAAMWNPETIEPIGPRACRVSKRPSQCSGPMRSVGKSPTMAAPRSFRIPAECSASSPWSC